jgi:hypothetical protein
MFMIHSLEAEAAVAPYLGTARKPLAGKPPLRTYNIGRPMTPEKLCHVQGGIAARRHATNSAILHLERRSAATSFHI